MKIKHCDRHPKKWRAQSRPAPLFWDASWYSSQNAMEMMLSSVNSAGENWISPCGGLNLECDLLITYKINSKPTKHFNARPVNLLCEPIKPVGSMWGGDLKVLIQVITFWTGHPNSGNRSKNWSMGWHQGEDCRAREVTSSVKGQYPERGKCLQTLHPKWLIYITCKELKGVNDNNISHTWCNLKMIE